ncbi:MAG: hypothetical protein PUC75_01810 [Lachnospiraceae bacterium]|nr:hypothetical protein [Lachnospiraceae bacterium]
MKRLSRTFLTLFLTFGIVVSTFLMSGIESHASGGQVLNNSAQVANLVFKGYNNGVYGPVSITNGILVQGRKNTKVYLVTLSGTENVRNQTTGYLTDLLSGFNQKNKYYTNVSSIIQKNIPTGSNLILAGHSLGGMIAQQIAADWTIKWKYNILNTVCFGSPLLSAGSREGIVKRLGDTSDVIPYCSGSLINNTVWAIAGLQRENGGYGKDVYNAHVQSYLREDEWGKYDVTGTKYGGAKLIIYPQTTKFYHSSVIVTW